MAPDLFEIQLRAVARAQAQAQFVRWSTVLRLRDEELRRIDTMDAPPIRKELDRQALTMRIAEAFCISENSVWRLVNLAETTRDRLPRTWAAFEAGDVDDPRVCLIASCAEKLTTTAATELLDANAVDYAITHTPAELRAWLKRFRAKAEPEPVRKETEQAIEQRRVDITHLDDGTSWLSALLPTGVAIAVGNRLRRAAKALPKTDPDTGERDRRTRDQKRADLVAHWLTSCTGTETQIHAEIAICIDATDLVGLTDGPAVARGEGEPLPPEWVRDLAASEHTLFRRLVLDPVGRVADTHSLGYQPSGSLRHALLWRDGTCRVSGCRAPAAEVDLDHELAHARGGPTSGANLRCLCRRHHAMKSHQLLPSRFVGQSAQYRERWHYVDTPVYEIDLYPAA